MSDNVFTFPGKRPADGEPPALELTLAEELRELALKIENNEFGDLSGGVLVLQGHESITVIGLMKKSLPMMHLLVARAQRLMEL